MIVGRDFISIMDPRIPPSFTSLLEGDDSARVRENSTNPIAPPYPHVSYPPYRPPNYNHQMYHQYYPPQPHLSTHIGSSGQNPRDYPPLYYP